MILRMNASMDDELVKLSPNNGGAAAMQLDMGNRLFGRDEELELLHQALDDNTTGNHTKSCLVHGLSGTGKTALLQEFSRSLENVYLLGGKYDQYTGMTTPFSAILSAFHQLSNQLQPQHEQDLRECLKFEANILTKLIPSLSNFSESVKSTASSFSVSLKSGEPQEASLTMASERLAVAFLSFLKAFCTKCQPIVLIMDDLQWMDRHSCDLLSAILNDSDLEHFYFLGGFRDEDRDLLEPFFNAIPRPTVDICVENLSIQAVNELLMGVLHCTKTNAESLGTTIYRNTAGNPYFVLQQLQNLHSQGLLQYNFATNTWEWNMERVKTATDLADNVIDVVSSRIRALPSRVQCLLKVAACLGYFVDINALKFVDDMHCKSRGECKEEAGHGVCPSTTFQEVLSRAIEQDLIECSDTVLKFSHDRIQQCVYELIEVGDARVLHNSIGEHLEELYNETMNDRFLLLAVDQLNRASLLTDSDEKCLALIKLNCQAARVAKQEAGIENAALFLRKATALVKPSFWRFYYDLILDAYISSAEMEFSLGRTELSDELVETILENASCERDTVRAGVIRFQTLGHQRQFTKAIKEAYRILNLVGEPLPSATLPNILLEYWRAQKETKNKTDEFFLGLAPTNSENIKIALDVLQVGSVYGWNSDTNFAGLAFLRAMRISVREGSFEGTPWIYSGFGFMLAQFGNGKQGIRFAQLSLSKGKTLKKESFPCSCPLTYLSVMHWEKPISVGLEPLLSGYRIGLETGDLFFGSICISCYALVYFSCGLPLGPFASDMHCFGGQLLICRQDVALAFIAPCNQFALNLLGESDDPVDLSRESIERNQPEFFTKHMLDDETDAPFLSMLYLQLFSAYILEDSAVLNTTLKRILRLPTSRLGGTHIMNYFFPFAEGLAGFSLAKSKKSKTGMRVAKKAISELSKVSKARPVNSIALVTLLQAEQATFSQPFDKVKKQFDIAIKWFSKSGHIHYNAVANELAGKFMLSKNDLDWAEHYLSRACFLYSDWNAVVKVEQMLALYTFVKLPEESSSWSIRRALQGKSRYDENRDALLSSRRSGFSIES